MVCQMQASSARRETLWDCAIRSVQVPSAKCKVQRRWTPEGATEVDSRERYWPHVEGKQEELHRAPPHREERGERAERENTIFLEARGADCQPPSHSRTSRLPGYQLLYSVLCFQSTYCTVTLLRPVQQHPGQALLTPPLRMVPVAPFRVTDSLQAQG